MSDISRRLNIEIEGDSSGATEAFEEAASSAQSLVEEIDGIGPASESIDDISGSTDGAVEGMAQAEEQTATWTETLLGIAAGISILESIGGAVGEVYGKIKDLALATADVGIAGGAWQEQRVQFENYAQSFGKSGETILDTIRDISVHSITLEETIRIAQKTLATGLNQEQLETVLNYAKKWSEATGEAFGSVAERMTKAFASGRFTAVAEMGIIIEKGADLETAVAAVGKELDRFGSTGFNLSDKVAKLGQGWDELWKKIGIGFNELPGLGEVFTDLSDEFIDLTKNLDTGEITEFFETLGQIGTEALEAIGVSAENLTVAGGFQRIKDFFGNDGVTAATSFSKSVVDILETIATAAGATWNGIVDMIQAANVGDWFTGTLSFISEGLGTISGVAGEVIGGVSSALAEAIDLAGLSLAAFVDTIPGLETLFGTSGDEVRKKFNEIGSSIKEAGESARSLGADLGAVGEEFGASISGANDDMEGWKVNLDEISDSGLRAKNSISSIGDGIGDFKSSLEIAATADREVSDKMTKFQILEEEKRQKELKKERDKARKEEEKAQKEADKARLKEVQKGIKDEGEEYVDGLKDRQKELLKSLEAETKARQDSLDDRFESEEKALAKTHKAQLKEIQEQERKISEIKDKDERQRAKDRINGQKDLLKEQQSEEKKALKDRRKDAFDSVKQEMKERKETISDETKDAIKSAKDNYKEMGEAAKDNFKDGYKGAGGSSDFKEIGGEIGAGFKESVDGTEVEQQAQEPTITVRVEGENEFFTALYEKMLQAAFQDAIAKGVVVVTQ